MCYFCEGSRPSYQSYLSRVLELRNGVTDTHSLLFNASAADKLRFQGSPEWTELALADQVQASIFRNPDPGRGLLLFFVACWLDLQAPYTRVWTRYLLEAEKWLNSTDWSHPDEGVPRGSFSITRCHLLKTVGTLATKYDRSLANWFADSILDIAATRGPRSGNLYRFVARVCSDLYSASSTQFTALMADGKLPIDYLGQHYKRLWMLMMFIRRDELAIRCLISRALVATPRGREALGFWTDDLHFDPKE